MNPSGPVAGAWVLTDRPARNGVRRATRVGVAWWFANVDSAVAIGFAALIAIVAPTWTRDWSELILWELGAVAVILWALRLARTGLGVSDSHVRVYRWWGNCDVRRKDIERFDLTTSSGRFPRDRLTIFTGAGKRYALDRINIPRWGLRAITDDRARAAAESVPGLVAELNAWLGGPHAPDL